MNKILKKISIGALLALSFGLQSCSDGLASLISIDQDKQLGEQVKQQIFTEQGSKILTRSQYPAQYNYLDGIFTKIKTAAKANTSMQYADVFNWELFIIKEPTLNAFCTPGGKIFVYTGILRFLDNEDDFAGVLGHECAHADRRHTSKQMVEQYGLEFITSLLLGQNAGQIAEVAKGLVGLNFSRTHETDADAYSVKYLCGSGYATNGASSFFAKLLASGQGSSTPAFLSTHPDPGNRVANINSAATTQMTEKGCSTTPNQTVLTTWSQFKASLP
jgi:predicted Zn-dependent protease